jgi:hypothetical protein
MASFDEVERFALALSENERARLAAKLIESLSNVDPDEEGGSGAARVQAG